MINVEYVIESASGESRSKFEHAERDAIRVTCETDDTECCTKALRLVSGSDTAVHPRNWEASVRLEWVASFLKGY
jgi:hypothetical protein